MSRNPLQTKLISIVEPVCNAAGYDLVELRFVTEQGGPVLRIAVDLPLGDATDLSQVPEDRVDLSDCENLSRELSAVLDVDDPIPGMYSLEVSSPGIDRPLRTPKHFAHFVGSDAKISLAFPITTPTGERKNFRGVLAGFADGKVAMDVDGQRYELPLEDIETAKLVPDWDAVMAGKSGIGPKLNKPIKPGHRPSTKSKKNKQQTKEQG
ncbi:MAG: ribosome maturation factor RimP [Deltaproteobacteria bacterium]|nr:ribosome maturation factor RimP [Deltaproteobacteria bacterium]